MIVVIVLGIYIIGFLISLWVLPSFYAHWVGMDHYDAPNSCYDDFDSNEAAWIVFSLAWFIFYPFTLLGMGYIHLEKSYKRFNESE